MCDTGFYGGCLHILRALLCLLCSQLGHLELWYLVIPGFCLFGLFWSICHVILLITIWGFHTKLNECQKAWRAQRSSSRSLDQVMASRGIRHFCLISERLVFFSLLSTVILGAVSWQVGGRRERTTTDVFNLYHIISLQRIFLFLALMFIH